MLSTQLKFHILFNNILQAHPEQRVIKVPYKVRQPLAIPLLVSTPKEKVKFD